MRIDIFYAPCRAILKNRFATSIQRRVFVPSVARIA